MIRTRRASAALEFALTLPMILLILVGIVELSMLMHRSHVVSRVARDACRSASMVLEGPDPTGDVIEASAVQHARRALLAGGIDCDVLACDLRADWARRGDWMMLAVDLDVPYTPLTGLLPGLPRRTHGAFVLLTQQQIIETP